MFVRFYLECVGLFAFAFHQRRRYLLCMCARDAFSPGSARGGGTRPHQWAARLVMHCKAVTVVTVYVCTCGRVDVQTPENLGGHTYECF